MAEGTADELKSTVGNSSLQLVLADPTQLEYARGIIRDVLHVDATLISESRRITAPMAAPDTITDLLVKLRSVGISVTELSVQKPTLDEVLENVTHRAAGTGTDTLTDPAAREDLIVFLKSIDAKTKPQTIAV